MCGRTPQSPTLGSLPGCARFATRQLCRTAASACTVESLPESQLPTFLGQWAAGWPAVLVHTHHPTTQPNVQPLTETTQTCIQALARDVVYDLIPVGQRREWHGRLAFAMEMCMREWLSTAACMAPCALKACFSLLPDESWLVAFALCFGGRQAARGRGGARCHAPPPSLSLTTPLCRGAQGPARLHHRLPLVGLLQGGGGHPGAYFIPLCCAACALRWVQSLMHTWPCSALVTPTRFRLAHTTSTKHQRSYSRRRAALSSASFAPLGSGG